MAPVDTVSDTRPPPSAGAAGGRADPPYRRLKSGHVRAFGRSGRVHTFP